MSLLITEKEERRQKPTKEPLFRDSLYFNAIDPSRKIALSTSIGLRPNLGSSEVAFILFHENDILIPYVETGLSLPDEDWDNICVGNVCYQWLKPLKKFKISYQSKDVSGEVIWDGFTPIFDYKRNVNQLPGIVYSLHYEQAGIVKGKFDIKGEKITFKGYGIRDHSAGVRDWNSIERWYFLSGIKETDFVFCVWTIIVNGDSSTGGWIYKNGELLGVKEAKYNLKYRDKEKTLHKGGRVEFLDDDDNVYIVDSEIITNIYQFDFGKSVLNEAYAQYVMGDKQLHGLFELLWRR